MVNPLTKYKNLKKMQKALDGKEGTEILKEHFDVMPQIAKNLEFIEEHILAQQKNLAHFEKTYLKKTS